MTEQEVIHSVAEALNLPAGKLRSDSLAGDFQEWDSMGMLVLLTLLDKNGIQFDPGDTSALQSVQGILAAFRKAGRLD